MTEPHVSRIPVDGVELATFDWPGDGPAVLLTHGAGLHSRCWDLAVAAMPGRRCVAFDFPGHGQSGKPVAPWSWPALAAQVIAVTRALGLEGAVAAGHSMGGYAITLAALLERALFSGLLLVDPVIFAPDRVPGGAGGPEGAARRRNAFASPDEMFQRFHRRPPFDRWKEQALRDYCEHGLLPAPGGDGFVLACDPALEVEVYRSAQPLDRDLSGVAIPVRILRARTLLPDGTRDMSCSPTDPALVSRLPNAVDLPHPELGHGIPMEAPELIAAELATLIPQR